MAQPPGNKLVQSVAAALAGFGVDGDTMLVHINPREVALLKAHGGAGTRNPVTGLLQFYDDGGNDGDPEGYGGNDSTGAQEAAAPAMDSNGPQGFGPPNPNTHDAQSVNPNAAPGPTLDPNQNNLGFVDTNAAMQAATPSINSSDSPGFAAKALAAAFQAVALAPLGPIGTVIGLGSKLSGAFGGPTIGDTLLEHGDRSAVGGAQNTNGDARSANPLVGYQDGQNLATGGLVDPGAAHSRGTGGPVTGGHPGAVDDVHAGAGRGSIVLTRDDVAAFGHGDNATGVKFLSGMFPADKKDGNKLTGAAPVNLTNGEFVVTPGQLKELGHGDETAGVHLIARLVHRKRAEMAGR